MPATNNNPESVEWSPGVTTKVGRNRYEPGAASRSWVLIGLVLAATLACSFCVGISIILPILLSGAFLFLVLAVRNPSWFVHMLLIVLFATRTEQMPRGVRAAGVFIYYHEFLIVSAVGYAIFLLRSDAVAYAALKGLLAMRVFAVFSGVLALGVLIALINGHTPWDIQFDLRPVVDMLLVGFVAATVVASNDWRRYIKTIAFILSMSAVAMVYASVTGTALGGRTETAELYASGGRALAGGSSAIRYLTDSTAFAMAALLGCVAVLIIGKARLAYILPILVPALVISLLSFSRNTLLALGGTILCAILVSVLRGNFLRGLAKVVLIPLVGAAAVLVLSGFSTVLGAEDWVQTQVSGYSNRVIAGLSEANERADTSARYRQEENSYISKTGAESPLVGSGFGTHYKPPSGKRGSYYAVNGTMYTHNFYNWVYVKLGILGLATFVGVLFASIRPSALRHREYILLCYASSTLVGLGLAMFVTPMPIDQPGSSVIGIVLGVCVGAQALPKKLLTQ